MNYAKIKKNSIGNWLGISVSLYCSGCPFHCKGCFQSETWNPKYGEEFTDEVKEEIFKELEKPYYDNLVLLGGEPLEKYNVETMTEVAREFKNGFAEICTENEQGDREHGVVLPDGTVYMDKDYE